MSVLTMREPDDPWWWYSVQIHDPYLIIHPHEILLSKVFHLQRSQVQEDVLATSLETEPVPEQCLVHILTALTVTCGLVRNLSMGPSNTGWCTILYDISCPSTHGYFPEMMYMSGEAGGSSNCGLNGPLSPYHILCSWSSMNL